MLVKILIWFVTTLLQLPADGCGGREEGREVWREGKRE